MCGKTLIAINPDFEKKQISSSDFEQHESIDGEMNEEEIFEEPQDENKFEDDEYKFDNDEE